MIFSVSVKFNRFNGYWDFQISMDVLSLVPIFKVSLICKSRNFGRVSVTFLLKQVISEFILVFDICRGDSSWIPVSQCEE